MMRCSTAVGSAFLALAGCERHEPDAHEHDHPRAEAVSAARNRVAIPASVRQNLGITFVTVEKRPVHSTIRLPGQFELRPEARREYHVMLPGRIELLVKQYDQVTQDQPLFYLDSPEWQRMQSELVSARNSMRRSHADVAVAEANLAEMEKAVVFLETRLANLAEAQVRQVELEAELADKRNILPRLQAQLDAARTEFDAAHARYDVLLSTAASFTEIPRVELDPHAEAHGHLENREAPWRSVERLLIRAEAPGVVNRLAVTNRGWAETGELVLDTVDPTEMRFHADALQTDITLFHDGQPARIVPPPGGSIDLQDTAEGTINVGFEAHPQERVVPIFLVPDALPSWAKPGVTAYLEVFIGRDRRDVLAIPEAAVVRDGLDKVFFRRDPHDPNQVIRVVADLGASDGRWVEVKSGVMFGDDIVLGGVYPLMLASSSSGEIQEGGHFHADGTFHESDDH
jgi:multidrug efflux pump subunit AcrA (membrane-fusion protein)